MKNSTVEAIYAVLTVVIVTAVCLLVTYLLDSNKTYKIEPKTILEVKIVKNSDGRWEYINTRKDYESNL